MPNMPAINESNIQVWVGESAAAKGEVLFEQGRVNGFELRSDGSAVASVRGEDIAPFQVEVAFADDGAMLSHCSCPVGEKCRHVAALCYAWMDELEGDGDEDVDAPPSFAFGQWLGALGSVGGDGAPVDEYPESTKQRLLYILEPEGDQDVRLRFITARLLKSGHYGKPEPYEATNVLNYSVPKYILPADEKILREVATDRSFSSLRGYCLKGEEGLNILKRMISSGRCHWMSQESPAIKRGDKHRGEWLWKLNRHGDQHLSLQLPQDEVIVPSSPPWYINTQKNISGPIESGQAADVAEILLNMPAVELDCDDHVLAKVASQLPKDVPVPLRLKHDNRQVKPLPRLKLYTRQLAQGQRPPVSCHIAELWFDYDGQKVEAHNSHESVRAIRGDHVIDYRRDRAVEQGSHDMLEAAGLLSLKEHRLGELFGSEGHMFTLSDENYWPEWMLYGVPDLEAEGFIIEIADGFAFQVAHATEWHLDIKQAGQGAGSGLMGKASLTVTLEDGEEVDMISAIGLWVGKQPALLSKASLKELKEKAQLPLPLPDGRLLSAPGETVANILSFMLDLFAGDIQEQVLVSAPQLLALEESIADSGLPAQISSSAWLKHMRQLADIDAIPECDIPKGLKAELRDYQLAGLRWMQFLCQMQLGGILADDMGLGKTVQALAHILKEKEEGRLGSPALVIAPTSLMHNWRREAEKFAPDLSVLIVHGPSRARHFEHLEKYDLVLTTYPLLARDFDVLVGQVWHLLILDEAQNIKNPRAKGSQLVRQLAANHKLCMTGTPLENHLGELWAQFDFLMPGYLHDQRGFSQQFRKPIEIQGDVARQELLNMRLRPFMLRRTKEQVASELPEKTEIIRSIEIEGIQRELYESVRLAMQKRVRDAVASMGLAQSQIVVLDALLKMRQVCCDPRLVSGVSQDDAPPSAKLEMLLEMLPEMIEEGRRVLLFSQFTTMLGLIEQEVDKLGIDYVKLTGQTRDRETPVDMFQRGEVSLFLISLKAGGVGLNLTAADTVIHYDPWWNPAVEAQATDRAHRIGQDKAVFVYKLMTEGTVEESILELQERKRQLTDATIHVSSGDRSSLWSPQDLDILFSPLK